MPTYDYDAVAFGYFAVAILSIFTFIVINCIVRQIFKTEKVDDSTKLEYIRSTEEPAKFVELVPPKTKCGICTRIFMFFVRSTAVVALLCVFWGVEISKLVPPFVYDSFSLLGIPKSATPREIRSAYHKLALLHHPERGGDVTTFTRISEAYQLLKEYVQYRQAIEVSTGMPPVLIDPQKRYILIIAVLLVLCIGNSRRFSRGHAKPMARSYDFPVSLEDLYSGSKKKLEIIRNRSGGSEEEIVEFDIKPGWKSGTKITLKNAGDEHPGQGYSDIEIVILEKSHESYTREGNDLLFNYKISLSDAHCGTIYIPTLDGRSIKIPIPHAISPGYVHTLKGEGMPIMGQLEEKGNLKIKFQINFPPYMSEEEKEKMFEIFHLVY